MNVSRMNDHTIWHDGTVRTSSWQCIIIMIIVIIIIMIIIIIVTIIMITVIIIQIQRQLLSFASSPP